MPGDNSSTEGWAMSRARVAATVAATALVLTAVGVGAADAAVATISTVQVAGPPRAGNRSITATCPQGTIAVGGELTVRPATYGVHLTRVWPNGRNVTVTAEVFPGVTPAPTWAATVTARCKTTPAGVVYADGTVETAARTDDGRRYGKLSTALCPTGKELIGVGGRAQGGFIDELQPLGRNVPYTNDSSPLMHGVRLIGKALPGATVSATVQARAVCATAGTAPLSTFAFAETVNTAAAKTVTATCPAGKQVHSAGWVIFYPNHFDDNSPFSFAAVTAAVGTADLATVGVAAARHRDTVPAESWDLAAEFLCA
jgi:hypothetical protein